MSNTLEYRELLLVAPLYQRYPAYQIDDAPIKGKKIKVWCPTCEDEHDFDLLQPAYLPDCLTDVDDIDETALLTIEYVCSWCRYFNLIFYIALDEEDNTFMKIGQYPPSYSFLLLKSKEFKKRLGNELFEEYKSAISSSSQGYNIGSFIYLRRIFEKLIESAHQDAKKGDNWREEDYKQLKTEKRIKMLKSYLPQKLVEYHDMYSILSEAIHQLTEEMCGKMHPVLIKGIDLILEEKIRAKNRKEQIESLDKEMNRLRREKNERKNKSKQAISKAQLTRVKK